MSAEFTAREFDHTDTRNPAWFIWSHIKRHKLVLIGIFVGAFSNAALASAVPYFLGEAINAINIDQNIRYVGVMALAIMGSQFVRGALQLMRNYSAETFAQRIERDVRDELYVSLLEKSMTYHDSQPTGDIMARVTNDVRELNLFMSPGLNLIIGSSFFIIMPIVIAPTIHPALIIAPLGFLACHIVLVLHHLRSLHPVAQRVRAAFGKMNTRLAETLDGVEVVKGTAQEKQESNYFATLVDEVFHNFVAQGRIEARYFPALLLWVVIVGGFLHSVILYRADAINAGDIVNFMGQLSLFGFPVFASLFALSRMASGYAGAERILGILTATTDLDQNLKGRNETIDGEIVFSGVDFGYTNDKRILTGVDFHIKPGQTVALVGQTGSGKSTIAKLINRMYDVNAGAVSIDGVNVRDWDLESLRSQISIIEQEIFLFSRTIADNIAFGRPDTPREEIIEAAKKAQAHEFITAFLADGYDTVIGQRGVTLSGGQRQRIAIARAFITNPRILILDDSTSAIDSATEDHIQKAIWAAAEGRTTLIITHRLSQIRWADHIVVLKQGGIAAQGTHEDLLRESAAYQRIFARYEDADEPTVSSEVVGD